MLVLRYHEGNYSFYPRPHARQWPLYAQLRKRAGARGILGMQEQNGKEVRRASVSPRHDRHSKAKAFAWKGGNVLKSVQSSQLEVAGTTDAAESTGKAKANDILV